MKKGELKESFDAGTNAIFSTASARAREVHAVQSVAHAWQNPFMIPVLAFQGISFLVDMVDEYAPIIKGEIESFSDAVDQKLSELKKEVGEYIGDIDSSISIIEEKDDHLLIGDLAGDDFYEV